jgi:hypothetical protein
MLLFSKSPKGHPNAGGLIAAITFGLIAGYLIWAFFYA